MRQEKKKKKKIIEEGTELQDQLIITYPKSLRWFADSLRSLQVARKDGRSMTSLIAQIMVIIISSIISSTSSKASL